MTAKKQRNFRLTDTAIDLLARLHEELGADEVSIVEMAIREFAKRHGLAPHARHEPPGGTPEPKKEQDA